MDPLVILTGPYHLKEKENRSQEHLLMALFSC